MADTKFPKGVSGNRRGRPPNSLNKKNPQQVLTDALSTGIDMRGYKLLAQKLLDPEKTKLTEKGVLSVLKLMIETEVKLLEMNIKNEKEKEKNVVGTITSDEDDTEDGVFSLEST
jgi:hypothetical protein